MSELVGLLPAAGRATRLGPIPCSKEIMPLGFQLQGRPSHLRQPVTAIESHLHALKLAGAKRCVTIISESKSDIVRYLGGGERYELSISYLYQQHLRGMPFALDLATSWIGTATTLFSMPDTLITPVESMARVVEQHQRLPADLTLGLFHTAEPHKFGMVALDTSGAVIDFVDKPAHSDLRLMWGLAVWTPRFARFLGEYLSRLVPGGTEKVLSDVFLAALRQGLRVQALVLENARYHDIGTPEDFQAVVIDLAGRQTLNLP